MKPGYGSPLPFSPRLYVRNGWKANLTARSSSSGELASHARHIQIVRVLPHIPSDPEAGN